MNIKENWKVPEVNKNTKETKIKLQMGNKSILLTIHENNDYFNLYFGGHNTYCLHIQIVKQNSPFKEIQPIHIGFLHKIRYDELCSLDNKFIRGQDTNMILNLAITFIEKYFNYVKELEFKDASTRECDNGIVVSLSKLSYLTSGETWYQKNFSAYLKKADLDKFNLIHNEFQNSKINFTWNMMESIITTNYPEEYDIENIFNSTKTWLEFFVKVRNSIGVSNFCIFISPWFENFLDMYMKFNFLNEKYYIPIKNKNIEIKLYPYVKGGRRETRKNTRIQRKKSRDLR